MDVNILPSGDEQLPYLGVRHQIGYRRCNLNCPYCIAKWRDRELTFDLDTFQKIIGRIGELPYRVCLRIGVEGEIFTSPEILRVVTDICNRDSSIFGVSFSTNLHASWEQSIGPFIESANTAKLGIGCTLHDTVIKDVDLFFEKVARLKQSGVMVYVGYVALPQRIGFIREYERRCERLGVPLVMNALVGSLKGLEGADPKRTYPRDYTAEELGELRELWDTPHSYKLLVEAARTRGMACSAGKNYIYVDRNGDVYPCSAMKKKLIREPFMGNILQGPIRFRTDDTVCPIDVCWCGNENQALRIVDRYYNRTRTLRIFTPKEGIPEEKLYQGYNPSAFAFFSSRVRMDERYGRALSRVRRILLENVS